jgi:CRP/FNR family transcriptional regulator, cyclic AMP receptor protein
MAALEEMPRSTDALSLTATTIATIPAQDFIALIYSDPLAGVRLTKLMAKRLRQINRRLQLREADSLARVADAVLFLVYGQGQQSTQGIKIPNLPHREISSLCGLARETVTRALTKLEQKGLIRREGDLIYIPDIIALERTIN